MGGTAVATHSSNNRNEKKCRENTAWAISGRRPRRNTSAGAKAKHSAINMMSERALMASA